MLFTYSVTRSPATTGDNQSLKIQQYSLKLCGKVKTNIRIFFNVKRYKDCIFIKHIQAQSYYSTAF